jgi:TetR/AcrR family transcriptional regulator, transcriptional repressor of bet genes
MPKIVDHAERRHEIALAACQAIAKKGLDAVTLVDIAREAGCTTGMLAHYFSTKWDVILAALRLMHVRLEKRLSDGLRTRDIGLADLLEVALPTTPEHRAESAAWLTFWGVAISRPELLERTVEMHSDWRSLVRRCVVETTMGARSWPEDLIEDVVSSIVFFMDGVYVKTLTRASMFPAKEQTRLLRAHLKALVAWAEVEARQRPERRPASPRVRAPLRATVGRRLKAPTGH